MSRATVELDFFGMEKANNSCKSHFQKFLHRRPSFRGIQSAISKMNPELIKSVISTGSTNPGPIDWKKSFSVPPIPKEDRSTVLLPLPILNPALRSTSEDGFETAPLTIFYNGTVSVFNVPRDKICQLLGESRCKDFWKSAKRGKYYLVDSGYLNTVGYLSPIRMTGVRYHIPEYKKRPPKGMLEHFNYRHSLLRMSIECAFGLLKKRWKVLRNMPQMSGKYQMSIMVVTFTLHNFIKMHQFGIPVVQHEANTCGSVDLDMFDENRKAVMFERRSVIARLIWRTIGESDGYENDHEDDHVD